MLVNKFLGSVCLLLALLFFGRVAEIRAGEFDTLVKPLLTRHCAKCHGGEEVSGEINLKEIATTKQFLARPKLIKEMIEVIDANDMPPEGEPALAEKDRAKLLAALKTTLREATVGKGTPRNRIRRLNRFQYNNAVKDLFRLKKDVFPLPEKLMTRYDNYLPAKSGKMPDRVRVASHSLNPQAGLSGVKAFPKDLRASHGFDNQANQLTLSPLLLDAFLLLGSSILESPDFTPQNVGIWNDFFHPPPDGGDMQAMVRRRLQTFLRIAFRGPVESQTLDRYTAYAMSKMKQGLSFTDSMKKVASAALCSPMFLYRSTSADNRDDQYQLASRLSFFLWSSGPDLELLRLAESGQLSKPEVLRKTIERMIADPKIERFLDTFPTQWMQLENVLDATPDPQKYKLFSLDKSNPASLQMLLEPLLLFDAAFIENRPVVELLSPKFNYQSDFLKTWYTSNLKPPPVDVQEIVEENRRNDQRRNVLTADIQKSQAELEALIKPVRAKILAERKKDAGKQKPVDLKPYAAWEFNGDLKDAIGSLDLNPHGKTRFENGMVVLNRSYLLSKALPFDLKAKTLEIWCQVHDLNQRGGGLMGIQGPGDFFDTIVLGERKPLHWLAGSNRHVRTLDFPGSTPETKRNQMLNLTMVYAEDGTTTLYRDGVPYGKPYRKGSAVFPKNRTSVIFGLRHLPPGGNKYLSASIDRARLYNRALTAEEVAASSSGNNTYITNEQLLQALTSPQKAKKEALGQAIQQSQAALNKVPPNRDPAKVRQEAQLRYENEIRNKMRSQVFDRVAATDPRYGGVITNAAMLSMTSGPKRTKPIARGAWIIEVIFNDPPPPPPNDVPALDEEQDAHKLTIREKFIKHRENPTCAACHSRIDPLGFALENYDITGRWRDKYENGRDVDSSGMLLKKHNFDGAVRFKQAIVKEERRFAKAFTGHLLRFALSRELTPADTLAIEKIVDDTEKDNYKIKSLIREIILSDRFLSSK